MCVPALLYSSTFLVFLPFGLWVADCMKQHCTEHPPPPLQDQAPRCSSGCQFSRCEPTWGTVWVVYLLVFQATFFTYYAFLTAEQWGFILSCLSDSHPAEHLLLLVLVFLLLSLSTPWWRLSKPRYFRMVAFIFPPSSTWPPPPSWVEPWKICWWKYKLPIKKYLEEVSLSIWQMSVWWQ